MYNMYLIIKKTISNVRLTFSLYNTVCFVLAYMTYIAPIDIVLCLSWYGHKR